MYLKWGTFGEKEEGMGRKGGEGQYTANQGSEWTGIRATTQRRCSLSLWRVVRGSKLMHLVSLIHGLFVT
jgi:hypothetical protein